jgi:hypothetical protein
VISRKTVVLAFVLAAPFVVLSVAAVLVWGASALPGVLWFGGLIVLPIWLAVRWGIRIGEGSDRQLRRRHRGMPPIPTGVATLEDRAFSIDDISLPLARRPLSNLWTKVLRFESGSVELRLFQVVHADLLGEGTRSTGSDRMVVTCVLARVDADMPLVVVRPRREKLLSLPSGLRQFDTELESFNRDFQVFAEDAYAATAIVDQRTIEAIHGFDPGTAIEIGGPDVVVFSRSADAVDHLIKQARSLATTFPAVVRSLYPRAGGRGIAVPRAPSG